MRRGYQVAGPRADRKRVESRVAGRFVARETRHSFRFVSRSSRFSVALSQAGFCSGDGAMWRLEQSRRFAFAPCRLSPSNPLVTMGAPGSVLKNLTRRESRSPAATGHRLRLHVSPMRRRFGSDDGQGSHDSGSTRSSTRGSMTVDFAKGDPMPDPISRNPRPLGREDRPEAPWFQR